MAALASLASIVAPTSAVLAEGKTAVEVAVDAVVYAEKTVNFFDWNLAFGKVVALGDKNPQYFELLARLANIEATVKTPEVKAVLTAMDELAANKDLTNFYNIYELANKVGNENNKNYLLNELNDWGKKAVFTPEVVAATDALLKAWSDKTPESIAAAKAAASKLTAAGNLSWVSAQIAEVEATMTLSITSVNAINLKELEVKFNKPVDKDTLDKANFTFSPAVTIADPKLQEDNQTVKITVDAAGNFVNQTQEYKLTVQNVKDLDGNKIAKTVQTFKAFDATLPTVEKLVVTGPKTFDIYFSEPVAAAVAGDVTIKSGSTILAVKTKAASNTNKVSVELYSELTAGKSYTVTIKDYADFAGYKNVVKEATLDYVKDASAPIATLVEATQQYVHIKFDKPVKGLHKENFYHTFTAWTAMNIYATKALMDASGATVANTDTVSEVFVRFATTGAAGQYPLQPGNVNVNVLAKYNNVEVKDAWGNKFAGTTLAATVTSDTTAPVITKSEVVTKSSIKLTFDERVSNAGTVANYEILDSEGKAIDGLTIAPSVAADKKSVTLTLNKDLTGKTVTLNVKDLKDDTLNQNKLTSTYTTSLEFTDKEFAGVDRVEFDSTAKVLYVVYKEDMSDSAINNANYRLLDGSTTRTLSGATTFFTGNKVVKIELSDTEAGYVTAGTDSLLIANVEDLAGNKASQFQLTQGIVAIGSVPATLHADGIRAIEKNKVTIQFNQELTQVNPDDFELTLNNGTSYAKPTALETTNNTKGTLVTLTFAGDIPASIGASAKIRATFTVGTTNVFNVKPSNIAATAPQDKIAPSVVEVSEKKQITLLDSNDDGVVEAIAIQYSENINAAKLSALTYEVKDRTVTNVYTSATAVAGTPAPGAYVIIELSTTSVAANTTVHDVTQKLDIFDANDNKLAASTDAMASLNNLGPAIKSVTYNAGGTLTVVFSKNVLDSSLAVTDFTLGGDALAGTETITLIESGVADDNTVTLTLSADPTPATGETITLALSGANVVSDTQTVAVTSTQTGAVTYTK